LNTIQDGHGDVQHEDIWIEAKNGIDRLLTIRDGSDNFKFIAQLSAKICEDCLTIISE
jgi:hypothetical protein